MQQTRSTLPGLLLALVAVFAWGLSYIATEWLYTHDLGPHGERNLFQNVTAR